MKLSGERRSIREAKRRYFLDCLPILRLVEFKRSEPRIVAIGAVRLSKTIPTHTSSFYADMDRERPAAWLSAIAKQSIDFTRLIAFNGLLLSQKIVWEQPEIKM